jgi:general secretion pathway protein G
MTIRRRVQMMGSMATAVMAASGCREKRSGNVRVLADFQSGSAALKTYQMNAGQPPTTEQGLEALVTRPTLEPLPEVWVQIAEKVPMDPWKQPYHYRLLSEADGVFRWELRSGGPDGIAGNEDDLAEEFEWKGR